MNVISEPTLLDLENILSEMEPKVSESAIEKKEAKQKIDKQYIAINALAELSYNLNNDFYDANSETSRINARVIESMDEAVVLLKENIVNSKFLDVKKSLVKLGKQLNYNLSKSNFDSSLDLNSGTSLSDFYQTILPFCTEEIRERQKNSNNIAKRNRDARLSRINNSLKKIMSGYKNIYSSIYNGKKFLNNPIYKSQMGAIKELKGLFSDISVTTNANKFKKARTQALKILKKQEPKISYQILDNKEPLQQEYLKLEKEYNSLKDKLANF